MADTISTRNEKSQREIFPVENVASKVTTLNCDMGKPAEEDVPEIHLGDWLSFFEMGASEAAEIAGCTQGYISNIVGGRKPNINVLYLLKLSEHLGVTINDFYRPLPNRTTLNALKNLSPKAQAAILDRQQKKA